MTNRICLSGLLCLFALGEQQPSIAQSPTYYEFHPQSIMSLGLGFSVEDLTEPKQPCVVFDEVPLDRGALGTNGTIQIVSNSRSLRNAVSLDASVDVSYLMFKGSTHFSYSEQNMFSTNDLSFVVKFGTEYARAGISAKTEHLTDLAQSYLTNKDFPTFKKECGTHMVLIEHRGSTVAAIITLHDEDSAAIAKYSGSMSGEMNLAVMSGDLKATLSGEMNRAARDRRLDVQIVSTGGKGFGELSALISQDVTKDDFFGNLQKALAEYIKSFTADNAAPIGFSVGPMLGLADAENDLWNDRKEQLLAKLVDEYRADQTKETAISAILAGQDIRANVYSKQQLDDLRHIIGTLNQYTTALAAAHAACKAARTSDLSACAPPPNAPAIPDFIQPVRPPSAEWFVAVDGVPQTPLQSIAIFEDPGMGSLLDRTQRRMPNAKEPLTIFAAKSNILDAQLLVGNAYPDAGYPIKTFYPGKTIADKLLPPGHRLALAIGEVGTVGPVDVDVIRVAWAEANSWHCIPSTGSAFRIFVKVRDEFNQTSAFEIATASFSRGQVGGDILGVWLPTKMAMYTLTLDTTCKNVEEYVQPAYDNLYAAALNGARVGPYNMGNDQLAIIETEVRKASPQKR